MGDQGPATGFLKEFRDFLVFLGNLWGLLAGVSVFFPLSNALLGKLPLKAYGEEGGVYDHLSPPLITAVATVVTLFVLLATFIGRDRFGEINSRRVALRNAWVSFGAGVLFLIAYLVLHQVYLEFAWSKWGWGSGDPRKLFAEVPLMLSYVAFFSLLTRAFVLLGMIEYFGAKKVRQSESR